jgi:phosphohistidine phosphatase
VLYLLHHAEAVDALVDPQRPLTPAGAAHAEQLAVQARDRGVKPDVIWHSGKLRARQTAEPFWRLCNPLAVFSAIRNLQPADPPEWIRDVVERDERAILLVGHMPHMARLLEVLTGGDALLFPLHGFVAVEAGKELWRIGR